MPAEASVAKVPPQVVSHAAADRVLEDLSSETSTVANRSAEHGALKGAKVTWPAYSNYD